MNNHNCQCDGYLPRHERKGTGKGICGLVPGGRARSPALLLHSSPPSDPVRVLRSHIPQECHRWLPPHSSAPLATKWLGKCTRPKEGTGLKMGLYGGVEDRGARGDDVEEENYTNWDVLESNFV